MSVGEREREREGGKIFLTTASLAIRNSAQFVFIRANGGQTTEEDSKHTCIHCRVHALGMQTHINNTAGPSKTSTETWAHTTDEKGVCKISE